MKHKHQILVLNDKSRFKFVNAGRRGGKTKLIVEDKVEKMSICPPKGEIFYIGPTNQQAKEIIWEPLEERMHELGWDFKSRPSKSRFELSYGRKIYVIGAEKIRRIRGHKVFAAYLDELAFFETDLGIVWKAVRPALADYKGTLIACTTPDGKGTQAYDWYLQTLEKEDWKYFHWKTIDNPYIDPDEIEAAKREMDEKSFRQEYLATWESFDGLAYYNFDETVHIGECKSFQDNVSIDLLFDFNVNPTTILMAQREGGFYFIRKEYSKPHSSTVETIKTLIAENKNILQNSRIKIYGDAAGNNRSSNTGFSDYHYIDEAMRQHGLNYEKCIMGRNPSVIDRVSHVNAALKNYLGENFVKIDPSCKELIRDLGSQALDGRHPSDRNNLGHKADALGYYINWHKVFEKRKPQGTIIL